MNYQEIKKIFAMKKQADAAKQASENTPTPVGQPVDDKLRRTSELLSLMGSNMAAKQAAERTASTPCQRAFRRHMTAIKNAADTRTPIQKIKSLLDAKVASDPALRAMKILGEAHAAKEAREVTQEKARTVKLEQAVHKQPAFEKPLEGQEQKAEGRSVTFSDGRTINFPAADTTPVKSASDRAKEILATIRRKG